jgi:hypothetical protein
VSRTSTTWRWRSSASPCHPWNHHEAPRPYLAAGDTLPWSFDHLRKWRWQQLLLRTMACYWRSVHASHRTDSMASCQTMCNSLVLSLH